MRLPDPGEEGEKPEEEIKARKIFGAHTLTRTGWAQDMLMLIPTVFILIQGDHT